MTEQKLERRLAAILAADVVGYSRMMGSDDVATLRALQAHQKALIGPAIAHYRGHIFKTTGDGLLAEFASVVDAVGCAVMIQRAMLSRNHDIAEDRRIVFRIGINIGDVIIEGADIFGDGVNVATRLESVCAPGGVMISRTVRDQIRSKLPFVFTDLGERALKNIAHPVALFALPPDDIGKLPEQALPEPLAATEIISPHSATPRRRGLWIGAALVVAIGFGLMVNKARQSSAVIVDLFDAPPSLAAHGLTGKKVAEGVLQELVRLQAATRGSRVLRSLSNAWNGEITVELPESGLSIAGIDRLLKRQFGHDLHIDGDVVQTATGDLALSVHGNGVLAKSFTGPATELGTLTTQAAEYIYGQSQPLPYISYLLYTGRNVEAAAFAKAAIASAAPAERPYLFNYWGEALANIGGDRHEVLGLYQQALQLKPDYWHAYNNVISTTWSLGDEEGAWRVGEEMRKAAGGRPGRAPELYYANQDLLTWNLQATRSAFVADMNAQGGIGTPAAADGPAVADIDARLHDPTDAKIQLQTAKADASDPTLAALTHFVQGRLADEAGDKERAAAEMAAFGAAFANPIISVDSPGYDCWIAPAEEAAGHPAKADAALAAGGHFVDCYRFKADILDGRGDWTAAQAAYQAAVDLAPDLPAGYYSWGVALFRHGDAAGAIAKLTAAHQRGPHWADPLKAWGDVLAQDGKWQEALAQYDAALTYAPAWAALHKARDETARQIR